jgi:hypothetical protein
LSGKMSIIVSLDKISFLARNWLSNVIRFDKKTCKGCANSND